MIDEYHRNTSRISKSGLDKIARSPAHYWQAYLAPDAFAKRERNEELELGSAFHLLVLEPERFSESVALIPKVDLRTREGKYAMMRFEEEHGGKIIIQQDDVDRISRMRDAVFNHPTARAAFTGQLLIEHTIEWEDATTGAPCKCRFDCINTTLGVAPDLKSTKDASPQAFAKSVANYRYHVQEAFYTDGYNADPLRVFPDRLSFIFVAVEKEAPYGVAVYELDQEAVNIGRALYRRDLNVYQRCRAANEWPAYSNEVQQLSLPGWAKI